MIIGLVIYVRKSSGSSAALNTLKLDELEKESIFQALEVSKWIQKDAAKLLGVSPRSLNYKIKFHNIKHPSWKRNV
ncbi:hypothetical protein B6I21_07915 [candidate division KSB1 bacterium 4572_119]|nr:MAG: hypothetical protein B6I21_07915 [candidate division KSB1 bacterium 4572_119]